MKRLTTDTPNGNFETMLNFVHGKGGWAHIYDEDGKELNLITWALNHCHDRGCDDFQCETLEEYDDALSSCMTDFMECPIAMAYCFASQAVHMRSRLKMYEDAMSLERAQELSKAEKDGQLVVLPVPVGTDKVAYGITDPDDGPQRIIPIECNYLEKLEIWDNPGHEVVIEADGWEIGESDIGKTVFLTREEAEAALKRGSGGSDCGAHFKPLIRKGQFSVPGCH